MMLKTPAFWSRRRSVLFWLLLPASWLYRGAHAVHQVGGRPYRARIPVLCVGNLTVGGSGKTPTALAIAELVKAHGLAREPVFLLRGYGGRMRNPTLADPVFHSVDDIGDESLLLARTAPTYVAPDRAAAARAAETTKADLIIMDDGLQNTSLARTISLVVIDAAYGFGNARLLPAGPLRTPIRSGLKNADAVLSIGGAPPEAAMLSGKPIFTGRIESSWRPRSRESYLAFCGLGRPEKFFATLRELGAPVVAERAFPDHYPYRDSDLKDLAAAARRSNARLVTTEKDAARISTADLARFDILTVPVRLRIDDEAAFVAFLKKQLDRAR